MTDRYDNEGTGLFDVVVRRRVIELETTVQVAANDEAEAVERAVEAQEDRDDGAFAEVHDETSTIGEDCFAELVDGEESCEDDDGGEDGPPAVQAAYTRLINEEARKTDLVARFGRH